VITTKTSSVSAAGYSTHEKFPTPSIYCNHLISVFTRSVW
jgi:hypothetical protein